MEARGAAAFVAKNMSRAVVRMAAMVATAATLSYERWREPIV
jgi:hypothetical protein